MVRCNPVYRPSPGDEDRTQHSMWSKGWFYAVGLGFTTGIYTDEHLARQQVEGFSNGKWKKSSTWPGAVSEYHEISLKYHHHDPNDPHPLPPAPVARPAAPAPVAPPSPPSPPSPSSPSSLAMSALPSYSLAPPPATMHPRGAARTRPSPASRVAAPNPRAAALSALAASAYSTRVAAPSALRGPLQGTPATPPSTSRPSRARQRHRSPSPRPRGSMIQIEAERGRGEWREGDALWAIAGIQQLFESRLNLLQQDLSPVSVMQSRNRERLEAFAVDGSYLISTDDESD
ncbi:hypothetical protein C8R46DRAFT_1051324 [Mycena filopes]|nr:hypothetical protein C8R46DRAFT_1051324 [Mycena filopes]